MSKTWKRIKSSVSLSSMVQDGERSGSASHEHEEEEEEEEEVVEIHPRRPIARQERQERPLAPRPRRALPGGLASLPIDTPVHSAVSRGMGHGTNHFASPFVSPLHKNAHTPNAIASSSRSTGMIGSEMKQVGGRAVTSPLHSLIDNTESPSSQRSAAMKALFATGANSPHFSAIPAHLSRGNRPSPLSRSQSGTLPHNSAGQTPRRPIIIPRTSPESNTSSPSVKDLVRSFEEAAANRSIMSSSTEGDISLDLGGRDHSSLRRSEGSGEGFRRRSGLLERSFDARR